MADVLPPSPSATSDFIRGQITSDGEGKIEAPKNIIQTVQGARAIYLQYRWEHLPRIQLYSQIEGLIAGNPPYNPADLANYKLAHLSNFNNLDARALYERAALAYWNLLNEAQWIAKFELRVDTPESIDYADTLARHFNTVVREWPSFNVVFNTLAGQLVRFGISPVLWPDERDWRWRTIELSRFFVEDQAQSDIEQVTRIFVESIFTVQFLYEVYHTFEHLLEKGRAKDGRWDYSVCPWNLDELAKLLLYKANTTAKTDFGSQIIDMMDLQRRIQNGDLSFNAIFSDDVRIVSMLSQEYDGKVSQYMFDRIFDGGNFLYFANRQYSCMAEGTVIFTASPGEFTIHSNRGLGHKIFAGAQAMMQLDCSIVDAARMAATPLFQSMSTGSKDFEPIRIYPGAATNIGSAEYVKNDMGGNIQQLIGASQFILQKLNYNTANSGDDPAFPDRDQGSLSPDQARFKAFKEFSVLKNNIAHFYTNFDLVIRNMVIKMLNSKPKYPGYEYAKRWKDLCLEDGVPEKVFESKYPDYFGMPDHMKVMATRVVGDGSTTARIIGLESLVPIMGTFGPREQKEYKKQWIMATMGADYVQPFTQDSVEETGNESSLAGTENAVMRLGESPLFSPTNDQQGHFTTHLALGNDTIRKIKQQQIDAIQADRIFAVLIPHMQQHWGAILNNPFAVNFLEKLKKPWKELQDYATLNNRKAQQSLQAQIKKQQEQAEQTQQVLTDEELKTLKLRGDEARADFKVTSQVRRADEANRTRAEVMREKVQLDAQNKRLQITNEAGIKREAEGADVESQNLDDLRQQLENISGGIAEPQ